MVKNNTHEYGVWTCVRDWDAKEQLLCGVRPSELGCFWFEEHSRSWSYRGVNRDARLVETDKYRDGIRVEEALLQGNILIPVSRADDMGYLA